MSERARPVINYVECKQFEARHGDTCKCGAPLRKHALSALKNYMRANIVREPTRRDAIS